VRHKQQNYYRKTGTLPSSGPLREKTGTVLTLLVPHELVGGGKIWKGCDDFFHHQATQGDAFSEKFSREEALQSKWSGAALSSLKREKGKEDSRQEISPKEEPFLN